MTKDNPTILSTKNISRELAEKAYREIQAAKAKREGRGA